MLPADIRVVAWSPVDVQFDARFSALCRTYKYYFLRDGMDIEKMNAAAQKLVGEHDFRNFCKVDVGGNVRHFVRRILAFKVAVSPVSTDATLPDQVCEVSIIGFAFLWHQVRCMIAVLFMIGRGNESPEVIHQLLDVANFTGKPQYNMASEIPLVLYDCVFENIKWIYEPESHSKLIHSLKSHWSTYALNSAIVLGMLQAMHRVVMPKADLIHIPGALEYVPWSQVQPHVPPPRPLTHIPVAQRLRAEDAEKRLREAARRPRKQAAPSDVIQNGVDE